MIGNAGNEKPNEAERLAFTQTDNEKLMVKARAWVDNLLSGNGFGNDYTDEEIDQWARGGR